MPRRQTTSPTSPHGSAAGCVTSFPAIAGPDARILILGSMPGVASLRAGEYYAHPRNQFWTIMGEICGAQRELPYRERVERLLQHRIAVWDVLHSCLRRGSLDSAIDAATAVPNDLPGFLRAHTDIAYVGFNGALALQTWRRHFQTLSAQDFPRLECRRLPSTSPANASWSYRRKLRTWRAALPT
jgi:hypoxanthine-DNA glycosylase